MPEKRDGRVSKWERRFTKSNLLSHKESSATGGERFHPENSRGKSGKRCDKRCKSKQKRRPAQQSHWFWKRCWKRKSVPNWDGRKGKVAGSVPRSARLTGNVDIVDVLMPMASSATVLPADNWQRVGGLSAICGFPCWRAKSVSMMWSATLPFGKRISDVGWTWISRSSLAVASGRASGRCRSGGAPASRDVWDGAPSTSGSLRWSPEPKPRTRPPSAMSLRSFSLMEGG